MKTKLFITCLIPFWIFAQELPETMTLVQNGQACFRIITVDKATRELQQGLDDLATFTFISTGAKVEIVPESKFSPAENNTMINLHVGLTEYVKQLKLDLPHPYGFLIHFADNNNIVIAGKQVEGAHFNTMDGVSFFLETFLGVRFLMPGKIGTHIPEKPEGWSVSCRDIRRIPDLFVRKMSGVHGQAYEAKERLEQAEAFAWALRSGVTAGAILRHNHNVGNLLDPKIYAETHPHFFPLIDGQRRIPPELASEQKWRLLNWEPCYTADGIVDEAAKNIIAYFDQNPDSYSYSLSVNDTGNICQCENCLQVNRKLPPGSESQSYYEWVSKVVSLVKQKYPDRYFGLLNYWVTREMPENVKLDSKVIPIVCEDLKFYVDPALDAKLEERLAQWDRTASTIGWWDYGFEGSYLVPTYNAHYLAGKIKHLYHRHNLRVYTDELHPGRYWKNGPQNYMVLKLLWDIDRNPDELLDEWYELAVGKDATVFLKQYYAIWEKFWTEKIPRTAWFQQRAALGAPFLQRRDAAYLDALDYEDIQEALRLLEECVKAAPAGKQRQRAEFFRDYFDQAAYRYFIPYLNQRRLAALPASPARKILFQYTFSEDFQNWKPWQSAGHTAKLSLDKQTGFSQPGSLKLDLAKSLNTGMVFFRRPLDFTLEPGKNYRLSVWCKAENTDESSKASVVLYFPKKAGGVLGQLPGSKGRLNWAAELRNDILKDGNWHEMELFVAVPSNAWHDVFGVDCQLEFDTKRQDSSIFYDDFTIEEITTPIPGLLPDKQ